jgi:hypothetical protein
MRRALMITAASAAVSLASITGALAGRDAHVGEWAGQCGEGVQCWIEIAMAGEDYSYDFVVADRMDAGAIRCRVSGSMTRGPMYYSPAETFEDALGGEFQGSVFYAALVDGPMLRLGGGLTAGPACGSYHWDGHYLPIGW